MGTRTIYALDSFNISAATDGQTEDSVFFGSTNLVGGYGTIYHYNIQPGNHTYARMDTEEQPGYFTRKSNTLKQKAIVCSDGSLNMVYNTSSYSVGGKYNDKDIVFVSYIPRNSNDAEDIPWKAYYYNQTNAITSVNIDSSMYNYKPISMAWWFYNYNITSFTGLENLYMSNVLTTAYMFKDNRSDIHYLDLSSWDVSSVVNMKYMFDMSYSYKTIDIIDLTGWTTSSLGATERMFSYNGVSVILASDSFDNSHITNAAYMFMATDNLFGENATSSKGHHSDASYARLDKPGTPGLFSERPEDFTP
jgi:hypothetical protein